MHVRHVDLNPDRRYGDLPTYVIAQLKRHDDYPRFVAAHSPPPASSAQRESDREMTR